MYVVIYIFQHKINQSELRINSTKYRLQIVQVSTIYHIPYLYLQAQHIFSPSTLHLFISSRCLCLATTLGWTDGQRERKREREGERETERRTNGRSSPSATSAQHHFGLFKLYDWKINGHDRRKARGGGERRAENRRGPIGGQSKGVREVEGGGEGRHNYSTVVRAGNVVPCRQPEIGIPPPSKAQAKRLFTHSPTVSLSHTHTHTLPLSLLLSLWLSLPRARSVYCNNIAECKVKLNFLKWC